MTMMRGVRRRRWFKDAKTFGSLSLLEFVICVWCIKAGYCFYVYLTNGAPAAKVALLNLAPFVTDITEVGQADVGIAACRYVLLVILTLLLAAENRRRVRWLWKNVLRPAP